MNKFESASILAGMSPNEEPQVSEPTNLHVITGEVVSKSEDGTVMVSMDGLVFSEDDTQYIEMDTIGGLEEGDEATIILAGENGSAMTPLAIGSTGSVDRLSARVIETELLIADKADIEDLEAATARIGDLEADHVSVNTLEAATARIETLEVDHVSVADFEVEQANIDTLQAATADIDTIRANSAKVQNLTAAQLEADHATIGTLDTTYMHANMSNADVAWIQNGTIKNGAIVSAMINDVSANKLTAGTINGSVINVTNLNADNITAGTINGQRIGTGSLSLDKLSEDVYTEAEVNTIVDGLNDRIDGAIETHTGTAVPTLNNSPASSWNTTALKDEHVGDVYYVVNSQSQQNGYCYRFTKSGSTYSWQLIKDSDVTAALSRLTTAEGKITSIESFDSTVSSFMTNTDSELTSVKSRATSLETRMTDAEGDISEKVDTSTFDILSQTVDSNSASITSMSTVLTNNGLTSSTNITDTVNTVSQTASGNSSKITQLTTTLGTNTDGTTKAGDVVHRTSAIEQDVSSFKTTVSETYATKTAVNAIQDGNTRWYADYPRDIAVREFGIYGTDAYASTGQYENFSQDFLMRVDFVYDSDYTGRRYCLASPSGRANPTSGLTYPEVGIELAASTGKLRVYSRSDSNAITDKILAAVPTVDVWSTALLWWNASGSTFTWALISDGTIIGTGSYTPDGTYTGSSGEVRLGADSRTTNTWTTAYQQRDMPAIWYGDVPSSADYLCMFDTAEKVDGSLAAASSVMCVAGGNVEFRVTSAESAITQNAQNIELKVSKEEFNNLEIGGRNLLPSSIFTDKGIAGSTKELGPVTPSTMHNNFGRNGGYIFGAFEENTQYTFRVGAIQSAVDETWVGHNGPDFVFRYTDGTHDDSSTQIRFEYKDEAELIYKTLVSNPTKSVLNIYVTYGNSHCAWHFYDMKLEKGNKATDWTPAPEDIETRLTTAESSITQNANNIELKVSKDGVISSINQSAETVKIQANKVEIDGTAVFNAISSDVDDAITGKGYATTTQAQGYATTAKTEAISAAATDATSKANAAEANAKAAIPSDISELNNDSGFITSADVPTKVSDLTNDSGYQTASQVNTTVTSKGYQTSSQVESAITSKGYATTAQAQGYADAVQSNLNATRSWYATSSTVAETAVKVATITPATTDFALNVGTIVNVEFTATNSAAVAILKLNVNGTGEKSIKYMYNNARNNIPSAGYLVAGIIYQFMYDGEYWTIQNLHYNTNDNYNARQVQYYNTIKAGEALAAATIIGAHEDGLFYQMATEDDYFILSAPLLWLNKALKANATDYANIFVQVPDRNLSWYSSFNTGVANSIVYLVGTIDGNRFTLYGATSATYLTCTVPTTEDGLFYIPIGKLGNQWNNNAYFNYQVSSPVSIFAFIDGKFRQVTPTDIVASHRIYYRTQAASSTLAAPTMWVEEATGNVYNQWTTKVPPMAVSTAAGQTKYLYLYTCEQRKRLDGTTVCTKVLLDENTTIIDGGQIITHSITANQIAANTVTANEIDATDLHVAAANIDGTLTASQINASGLTIGQSQVTGLTTALNGKADTDDIPTNVSDLTNDSGFQTSSQVESAITGKGYQTSSQVESAITSKGYATTTQAQGYATTAKSEAISAAATDATTKANAAAETATSYVTEVTGQNGIMVHPSTDDDTGVRITSDVDIRQDNVSIANFGALDSNNNPTARLGKADDYHMSIDQDSLDVMDGTTTLASFGSEVLIGPTNDNHIEIGTMTNGSKGLALRNQDACELEITSREFFSPWTGEPFFFTMQGGNQHIDFMNNSGVEIWALGDPVESNYAKAVLKLNARIGTANQVGSFTFQTNAGSNTWSTPAGTVLWSGSWHMTAGHTATLKYNVSTCPTGIVLHFQPYANSTTRNWNHIYYFVPKTHVASSYNGSGIVVRLGNPDFSNLASKYLYISNDHITGNDQNNTSGTNSGITYNNAAWVMTQVIAV